MIELEHLSKTFHTEEGDVSAVNDVSLRVQDGEIFGIIGLSGAGKSTLVRLMNRLEKPTSGRVLFKGQDLAEMSEPQLRNTRRKMSMIFQDFNLLEQRTALKNVLYPLEIAGVKNPEAKNKALDLLKTVGLEDRAQSYPSQLSGGQKQRVAIARALASDPEVLLCDEATSALDPTTTTQILDLLKKINEERHITIVIITHAMNVVTQICDRVAVMGNGRVAEIGTVKDVFIHPQSETARNLILPQAQAAHHMQGGQYLRLVFDGQDAFEPIVSNLCLACRVAVNILAADTRIVSGKTYGQMVLQIPQDEITAMRIKDYLQGCEVTYEEVPDYVAGH